MCNKDILKEIPHQFENIDESWRDLKSPNVHVNPNIWEIGAISLADITEPQNSEIRNICAAHMLSEKTLPLPLPAHCLDLDERISEVQLSDFTPGVLDADIIIFQRYIEIAGKPECERSAEDKDFLSKFIEIDSLYKFLKAASGTSDDPRVAAILPVKKSMQSKNKPWYQQGKAKRRF